MVSDFRIILCKIQKISAKNKKNIHSVKCNELFVHFYPFIFLCSLQPVVFVYLWILNRQQHFCYEIHIRIALTVKKQYLTESILLFIFFVCLLFFSCCIWHGMNGECFNESLNLFKFDLFLPLLYLRKA